MHNDGFTPFKRDRYIGCLRQGLRHSKAARACGVCRQTIWKYKKEHPEFQEEIDRAEADYCDEVERYLLKAAKNLNTTALIFWLTNRSPERWKDRRGQPSLQLAPGQSLESEALKQILERLQKGTSND